MSNIEIQRVFALLGVTDGILTNIIFMAKEALDMSRRGCVGYQRLVNCCPICQERLILAVEAQISAGRNYARIVMYGCASNCAAQLPFDLFDPGEGNLRETLTNKIVLSVKHASEFCRSKAADLVKLADILDGRVNECHGT